MFRRVNPEQANALPVNLDRVAVNYGCLAD